VLTTILDLTASALLITGCAVIFGLGGALLAGAAASLALSWAISTKGRAA